MKSFLLILGIPLILLTANYNNITGRKVTVETDKRMYPTTMLWQTNTNHGVFELKEIKKDGTINQWYQHFVDGDGKELIGIVRQSQMSGPAYASIAYISTYTYNSAGNVSEEFEFDGAGVLLHHIIYRYSWWGNFLRGDCYDQNGKFIGSSPTLPEAHTYGLNRR